MRMALFTDTLGDVNGVARFIGNLAAHADRHGWNLLVVTSTRRQVPALANIVNAPFRAAARLPRYPELEVVWPRRGEMLRRVRQWGPDAIHVSTPGPVGLAGRSMAQQLGTALTGTYHTDFPEYVQRLTGARALGRCATAAMTWFYRPFDTVLVRSQAYAARVAHVGIGPERSAVLRPGVATELFTPSRRSRTDDGRVRCLYAGRLSAEKGIDFLARVWAGVQSRAESSGITAELEVVGDGPGRAAMEKACSGLAVRFVGYRFGEELARHYADSDVFIFPSVTDTLGQVVMEAQASGVPAVVSDRGGPPELVRHGLTGLVAPGGDLAAWVDAVMGLVHQRGRRREMGAAAAAHMAAFGFDRSAEAFWALNAEALEARRARWGRGANASIPSGPDGAARAAT